MRPIAIVLAALTLGPAAQMAGTPEAALRAQLAAFETRNWPVMWDSYTPRFHRGCPYARWLTHVKRGRATFHETRPALKIEGISTRIQGRVATLSYRLTFHGRTVAEAHDDLYVLISGRWLDEVDRVTVC